MPQNQDDPQGWRGGFNGLYTVAKISECLWTIPLHTRHGICYPGLPGFLCALLILGVIGTTEDQLPVIAFAVGWVAILAIRRWESVWLGDGAQQHSEYAGFPSLMLSLCPFLRSEMRARNLEPLVCMGLALLVKQESESLGGLLIFGAGGLGIARLFEAQAAWRQTIRMRDAEVAQHIQVARYRGDINEF